MYMYGRLLFSVLYNISIYGHFVINPVFMYSLPQRMSYNHCEYYQRTIFIHLYTHYCYPPILLCGAAPIYCVLDKTFLAVSLNSLYKVRLFYVAIQFVHYLWKYKQYL